MLDLCDVRRNGSLYSTIELKIKDGVVMRIADLPPAVLEKISHYRYDRIYEKHEGPWESEYLLGNARIDFLTVEGHNVLLPIDKENYPNIGVTRCIVSADSQTLILFFRDIPLLSYRG